MVGTLGTYYPACKRAVHHADTDSAITIAGRTAKTMTKNCHDDQSTPP